MAGIESLLLTAGAGFLAGFATGYALKKVFKLFLVVIGCWLAATLYMYHIGVIEVHWEKLSEVLASVFGKAKESLVMYKELAASIPLAGFAAGFILGLKYG